MVRDGKLRLELSPEERGADFGTVAITFAVHDGHISISEEWNDMDELWGDGVQVDIPIRIWRKGAAWLNEQLTTLA